MAMEAHSCGEMSNFVVYDTIYATPYSCNNDSPDTHIFLMKNAPENQECFLDNGGCCLGEVETAEMRAVQGRKRKRKRAKVSKNKEEAETQRMTHITVERNRRKLMNEHLVVLRSLMPQSYIQMGDQASIVGGAIDFVKELEHVLQSLEAQKYQQLQEEGRKDNGVESSTTLQAGSGSNNSTPFAQFFVQPQYYMSSRCCGEKKYLCNKYNRSCGSSHNEGIAEIEVTVAETHANIRVLSPKRLRQLSKLVAAFHNIYLTILHLNVTTLDPLVLYSICTKVEEGCQLNSADDIAGAVHHMFRIIEEEEAITLLPYNPHDLDLVT